MLEPALAAPSEQPIIRVCALWRAAHRLYRRCPGAPQPLTKTSTPQHAMGQRLLALACISSTTALECHVGRAHDSDLKAHSSDFVDGVALQTCPSDADACCVTFEAARCVPRVTTS